MFVEETVPADEASSAWLAMMRDLFAADGRFSPARLGSAVVAAGHLNHWLHTATGPFSASTALPTPSDVAFLLGHLFRTSRLLARVHAQTGDHFFGQVRQPHFTGLDADSDIRGDLIDAADEVEVLLREAADSSTDTARAAGSAWSLVRDIAAATPAAAGPVPPAPAHGAPVVEGRVRRVLNRLRRHWRWTVPAPGWRRRSGDADEATAAACAASGASLADQIGVAFGGGATFGPELTRTAAEATGTLVTYLATCLGPARSAAIPTSGDLAGVATSLTHLTHSLVSGLRQLADSPPGSESDGLDETDAAAIRASLTDAAEALRIAAGHLAAVSYTAAGPDLPQQRQ
ncbi:hypothetical protein [Polymorphospora lycopeni]|uniref:Uncharacterized protein n=1 Tax=Polymorphospora lycopeni TaxID=3140240 RepID=A0ABV5CNH9_9ACTN